MVRMVGDVRVGPWTAPEKVDVTREVGLYSSHILKGGPCMVRDLVDTSIHYKLSVITATQIGYLSNAMAVIYNDKCIPIINPEIKRVGGKFRQYSDGNYYHASIVIEFYTVDGRQYEVRFRGPEGVAVQKGLRLLGNRSLTIH